LQAKTQDSMENIPGRKLRILMVTPRYFPYMGGVESHVYQVCRRMAALGHDMTVLTADPSGELPKSEQVDGVNILRVKAWPRDRDYYFAPGMVQHIRSGKWDLMHVQSYHTLVPPIAMVTALLARIPYVLTFHGGGHSSRLRHALRSFQRWTLRPFLAKAKRLIAVASFEIPLFSRELLISPKKFALVPNGAELPHVERPTRSLLTDPLIASVGRLERYKGHQRVIAAMPYVLAQNPNVRLWIAGGGPYEPELRKLIEKLGLQESITIRAVPAAERETLARELSKASLFVLHSEYETHPIAVLEAVSLGVPALVADTSGLSELAAQGLATAIPLNCTDQQLAAAILDQLANPRKPKPVKLPTWDECANDLLEIYQEVLAKQ